MSPMTDRERVLTLLAGGRPDRVPWFGDLDYWATALIGRGQRPGDFKASDAYIAWHRNLRVGFYLQGYFPFRTIIDEGHVAEWHEGTARRRRIETPRGTLTETWTWLPESFAEAPTEHLVKTAADLPAYRWLFEHTRYEPDYAFAERRARQVGDMGLVLCYLPKSPFMQLVALDAGIAAVAEIAADRPEELAETLAVVRASHDQAARIALASPAEVLMIPENLSSEVVGPRFYELHMRDYHEHWCRQIAAAGKYSCVHLDGTLKGLLRQVASAGFTFIEAMTPAPVGDLEVERWASFCPDSPETVFWGGLPGVYFTDQVPEAEFERHTRAVLRVMASAPRYVLGVADQVPPDGLESRIRRVAELANKFGRYEEEALPIEFHGFEYDWFAKDSEGHYALFATAGEGFMPEEVAANYGPHEALGKSIDTPNLGTSYVWGDYASKGLYVFDWDVPGGPYRKVVSPEAPIDQTLKNELEKIPNLPTFDGSFDRTTEVRRMRGR